MHFDPIVTRVDHSRVHIVRVYFDLTIVCNQKQQSLVYGVGSLRAKNGYNLDRHSWNHLIALVVPNQVCEVFVRIIVNFYNFLTLLIQITDENSGLFDCDFNISITSPGNVIKLNNITIT